MLACVRMPHAAAPSVTMSEKFKFQADRIVNNKYVKKENVLLLQIPRTWPRQV